ncbi:hypothetical protein [Nocardioides sp. KR10-350]|uniref:hypothetical protein n=1 Tax=Nocardioides cheoyonin TaxID=3156615 RepID=UPI0032B427A9
MDLTETERARIAGLAQALVGSPRSTHALRAFIIEQQVRIEYAVNEVLSAQLAVDSRAASQLTLQVFSRISISDRLAMLKDTLDAGDSARRDRWPFLLPVLRKLVALRNALAHGLAEDEGDRTIITTWNRGKIQGSTYERSQLEWLAWQAEVAHQELAQLWATLIPNRDDWFVDDRFND